MGKLGFPPKRGLTKNLFQIIFYIHYLKRLLGRACTRCYDYMDTLSTYAHAVENGTEPSTPAF